MKKILQTTILCCVLISPQITTAASIEQKKYSPTAIIDIQKGETEGEAPLSINLDGSKSTDPQNLNLEYLWEYPDKTIQSKNPRSYKFKKPGKYTIKLTVKNSLGATDTSTLKVNILEKKEKQGDLSDKILSAFSTISLCLPSIIFFRYK